MPNVLPGDGLPPYRQFIVKLHSRCNLACDYCYVYTMADQRWRSRPRIMSRATIDHTVRRIADHARDHGLDRVDLIIHGGEPLLAGIEPMRYLVSTTRDSVPASVRVTVQTNATLLNAQFLELFCLLDIRVGVSLDGDARANDRHRIRPGGRGSYQRVQKAILELTSARYRGLFAGLLCTVDPANDPADTFAALLEFEPPAIDFLLPLGNWSRPPPGLLRPGSARTPYADWLIAVFERWYRASGGTTGIRLFEEIINVLLGGHSRVDGVGLGPTAMIVVETDGAIEQSDTLASAFEGAGVTGLHVARDRFDDVLRLPEVRASRSGAGALCARCRACELHQVCGGGLRAHRYRAGSGFDNPSVYCADLYRLIDHIRARLSDDLAGLRESAR